MVHDNEDARCDKGQGSQADEGPVGGEILEVNKVAEDGEDGVGQGESVGEVQYSMERYYCLAWVSLRYEVME